MLMNPPEQQELPLGPLPISGSEWYEVSDLGDRLRQHFSGKPDPFVALDLDRLERLIPSQRLAIGRLRAAVRRPDPFAETDLEEVLRTAATSCRFDW